MYIPSSLQLLLTYSTLISLFSLLLSNWRVCSDPPIYHTGDTAALLPSTASRPRGSVMSYTRRGPQLFRSSRVRHRLQKPAR